MFADPHHIDADPDAACNFDADADPYPACHFDSDPDPTFKSDAVPDPNADPSFQIKAQKSKPWNSARIGSFSILFCLSSARVADPDQAYHFDADPDPQHRL